MEHKYRSTEGFENIKYLMNRRTEEQKNFYVLLSFCSLNDHMFLCSYVY